MSLAPRVLGKVLHLRRKFKNNGDTVSNVMLDNIVWYSFPIAYPNLHTDTRVALAKIDNVKQNRKRYRRYVRGLVGDTIFSGDLCYLVSLTFRDDVLSDTVRSTRDRYAKNFLNSFCTDYFACLDFGKENGREHYHAIISTSEPMVKELHNRKAFYKLADAQKAWKYGFYSLRLIKLDNSGLYTTCNYALKSSDYAFKSLDEDNGVKPFHKRGVHHIEWHSSLPDERLPM